MAGSRLDSCITCVIKCDAFALGVFLFSSERISDGAVNQTTCYSIEQSKHSLTDIYNLSLYFSRHDASSLNNTMRAMRR